MGSAGGGAGGGGGGGGGGSGGNAGTFANMPTTYMPTRPKMGGLLLAPSEGYCAWVGGKPNETWTALDASASAEPISSNQYRPFNGSKSQHYRRQPLGMKWKTGSDLVDFKTTTANKLTDWGMDTIAHIPDPITKKMMNVIDHHTRFTLEYTKEAHAIIHQQFDKYDLANDADATQMFLDSIPA